jgi:hypothetical protein
MQERIKILPAQYLRDSRLERTVIEHNRAEMFTYMLIIGGILCIVAILL